MLPTDRVSSSPKEVVGKNRGGDDGWLNECGGNDDVPKEPSDDDGSWKWACLLRGAWVEVIFVVGSRVARWAAVIAGFSVFIAAEKVCKGDVEMKKKETRWSDKVLAIALATGRQIWKAREDKFDKHLGIGTAIP